MLTDEQIRQRFEDEYPSSDLYFYVPNGDYYQAVGSHLHKQAKDYNYQYQGYKDGFKAALLLQGETAKIVPLQEINDLLNKEMDICVKNGANSISMPDELVAISHFINFPEQYGFIPLQGEAVPLKITRDLEQLYNILDYYSSTHTYRAPRIGGVLAGCSRGEAPTPEQLTWEARQGLAILCRLIGKQPEEWMLANYAKDCRVDLEAAWLGEVVMENPDSYRAGIHVPNHGNIMKFYGKTREAAASLRDFVFNAIQGALTSPPLTTEAELVRKCAELAPEKCESCSGRGKVYFGDPEDECPCPECDGSGEQPNSAILALLPEGSEG